MTISIKPVLGASPARADIEHEGVKVAEINAGGIVGSGVSFNPTGTGLVSTNMQDGLGELTEPNNAGAKSALNASGAAPIYACRAWVNFNGTNTPPTIRASGNVSSVTKPSVAEYTVNFIESMPDGNFAVNVTPSPDTNGYNQGQVTNISSSSVTVRNSPDASSSYVDSGTMCVTIFR